MGELVVVTVHEGVGDEFPNRLLGILPPILSTHPGDNGAALHVPAQRSERLRDHSRDRAINGLVVQKSGAILEWFSGCSRQSDERDVELRHELLRESAEGEQSRQRDGSCPVASDGDTHHVENLVVACGRETRDPVLSGAERGELP